MLALIIPNDSQFTLIPQRFTVYFPCKSQFSRTFVAKPGLPILQATVAAAGLSTSLWPPLQQEGPPT